MKKLLFALLIFTTFETAAQNYNSAIGLRGGVDSGITYKAKLNDFSAAEGIASFRYRGVVVTGLYTIQNDWDIKGEPFQWYYGGGGHVGLFNSRNNSNGFGNSFDGGVIIGLDGIIGMEYTFPAAPINISLDYKPAFNLVGDVGFWWDGFSLGVRYVLD